MDPNCGNELEIFQDALEQDEAELTAFLQRRCAGNQALRDRVQVLIKAHRDANDFLETPPCPLQALDLVAWEERNTHRQADDGQRMPAAAGCPSILRSFENRLRYVPLVHLRAADEKLEIGANPESNVRAKPDESILRYEFVDRLASGAMGCVIRSQDHDLGRELAVKVLLPEHQHDPQMTRRFIEEAQIGGQLQHPGIAPVYELGRLPDGRPFFSMKLVQGETLKEILQQRLDPADDQAKLLGIFEQICQTMAYAHQKGVIHRDLKPANIMVGAFGEVQVMDWGLAKVLANRDSTTCENQETYFVDGEECNHVEERADGSTVGVQDARTRCGKVMGTLAYMSPEQARGEIDKLDERTDVFSLGAVLCEILTGQPAYTSDDRNQCLSQASRAELTGCLRRIEQCEADSAVKQIALKALSPNPSDRPRNAKQLAASVTRYLEEVQERVRKAELAKAATDGRAAEEARRKWLYLALAGLLFIGIVGSSVAAGQLAKMNRQSQRAAAAALEGEQKANRARRRAEAERLASESKLIMDRNPVTSVLLAIRAVELAEEHKLWPLPSAYEALLQATQNLGGRPMLTQASRIVKQAVSDNDRLVTFSFSAVEEARVPFVDVWDMAAPSPAEKKLRLALASKKDSPWSVSISSDGKTVMAAGLGSLRVWKLDDGADRVVETIDLIQRKPEADKTDAENPEAEAAVAGDFPQITAKISPDGRWVVASYEQKVRIWDMQDSRQESFVLADCPKSTGSLGFSPNSEWLCWNVSQSAEAGSQTFVTAICNLANGRPRLSIQPLSESTQRQQPTFSPSGRFLLLAGEGGASLYDFDRDDLAGSRQQLTKLSVRAADFSDDGRMLATAGDELVVYDLRSELPLDPKLRLIGHSQGRLGGVLSVRFTQDGKRLVSGGIEGKAIVWHMDSIDVDQLPKVEDENGNPVAAWDIFRQPLTGKFRILHGHKERVNVLEISSDDSRLFTGSWDGHMRFWDLTSENPGSDHVLLGHAAPVYSVAFSPNNRWAVTGSEDQTARLWDLTRAAPAKSSSLLSGTDDGVRTLAFSSDSRWLLTASRHPGFSVPNPVSSKVLIWDLFQPNLEKPAVILDNGESPVVFALFSPDDRWIATVHYDGKIRLWDWQTGESPRELPGHDSYVPGIAFSRDSEQLLTGDLDGVVRLWDLQLPDPLIAKEVFRQSDWVMGLQHDGNYFRVLTAGWLRDINLWTVPFATPSQLIVQRLDGSLTRPFCVEFGTDWVALPSGVSKSNAALSGEPPYFVQRHDAIKLMKRLSDDGLFWASVGEDRSVRISDLSHQDPQSTTLVLQAHDYETCGVAISPDKSWVVSSGSAGTARLWDMNRQRLVARAKQLTGRELSPREIELYQIPALSNSR